MTCRRIAFVLYASLWLFLSPAATRAVTFNWNGPGGVASYEDQTSWSPAGGPPTAGDEAHFGIVGAHTVTIDPSKPVTSDQFVVEKGDYTFRSASAGTAQYDVGALFTTNQISQANVTLGATGLPIDLNLASDLRVDFGSGLDIEHGSAVSGEDLFAGLTGGTNTIAVSGPGSSLDMTGVGVLGANGAGANLSFNAGATGSFGRDLTLINFSNTPDTQASLNLNTGSSLTLAGVLGVGLSSSSTAGAQSATVNVRQDSTLTQTGTNGVAIGISSSSNPSLSPRVNLNSGGVINTGTGSTLIRHNGAISVTGDGSTYNANGQVVVGGSGGIGIDFNGVFNANAGLDNSADGAITLLAGTLRVAGGAFLPNSGGDYEVNGFADTNDLRLVLGTGSITNISGAFRFGTMEDAHLTVEAGAQLTSASTTLGPSSAVWNVTATVDGAGTLWDSGPFRTEEADTDLTIADQAVMTSTSAELQTGTYRITGNSHWDIAGLLAIDNRTFVQINTGGRLTTETAVLGGGFAAFSNDTSGLSLVDGQWRNTGNLWIGGAFDGELFESEVRIGVDSLVQVDGSTNLWGPGSLRMMGGTLDLNGPLVDRGGVFDFDRGRLNLNNTTNQLLVDLTGLKVDTMDLNAPSIDADRAISVVGITAITVGATLRIDGGDVQLARLVVSPGASVDFSAGSFGTSGPLQATAGSILDLAGGDVALGDGAAVNGVYIGGELHAHANTVTLNDANDAVFDSGALATLAGGEIVASNGLTLNFGGNLTGHGDITTPDDPTKPLTNNGHLTGDSMAQPITLSGYVKGVGTLDNVVITGTDPPGLSPAAVSRGSVAYAGVLEIEIGGDAPGSEHDQLNHILAAGLAELGGSLEVQMLNGFQPALGDTFDIITASGGISGEFSSITSGFEAVYSPTSVLLIATSALPGDFNNDGIVDAADYTVWRDNLNAPAGTLLNDFAGGTIGPAQYDAWVTNFGATLPSITVTIPEPSTVVAMAFFVGWIFQTRPDKPC